MSDTLPVHELEVPPRPRSVIPFLWLAIVMLTTSGVTAVATGAADETEPDPQARLAAAAGALEEVDFAFEITVASGTQETDAAGFSVLGAYDVETRRIQGSIEAAGESVEFIQEGVVQYLHLAASNPLAGAAGGKPWLRMDFTGMIDDATRATPIGENPLDTFARLGEITSPIVRVDEERVRGVETVHFRTTVDASKRARASASAASLAPLRNLTVDVWLDDDDRPRRHRQTMKLDGLNGTTVVSTMESFDYGKAVSVELPPADQVGEFDPQSMGQQKLEALTELSE